MYVPPFLLLACEHSTQSADIPSGNVEIDVPASTRIYVHRATSNIQNVVERAGGLSKTSVYINPCYRASSRLWLGG